MPYKFSFLLLLLFASLNAIAQQKPLRVGVIGLTHTHVHGILGREDRGDIEIVGIVEPDKELAGRYASQYRFPMSMVYNTTEELIAATHPEAVTAFNTTYEHLKVVETCAPLGIHVMVEKPLAVSIKHARKMEALAKKHHVQLLTNYETTWYPTNHKAYELLQNDTIGSLRKVVVHDGHRGPKKIGVNKEFLDWLTDPVQDGGGAIMDFGCYGANLMTWLQHGKKPLTVTAVTQQMQPENNPNVDDDAIILLTYEDANAVLQPSWDWPIGRKDMEIYGLTGAIYADNRHQLRLRMAEGYDGFKETTFTLEERPAPLNDPFAILAAVVKKEITLPPYDLSSLENNMVVMEILDAARKSAKKGKRVRIKR
ncbi:MAG: Gfo/Idh/MocA family oxidoreductase [Saprospiraceae bacterium]|nr:Gfo/Idh/MocA family oxidoreductase [Saprospiraceae bacterium]